MIVENKFLITSLKTIVIFGESDQLNEILKINKKLNLSTIIITSQHQSKLIDKKLKFSIFNNLNNKFKKFIKDNTDIEKSLFVSLGARYIFKKDTIKNFLRYNLVNFHGTRLPYDAGGGAYSWQIMREDRIDNQLVHLINEEIDAGPIIYNKLSLYPRYCKIPKDFKKYKDGKFLEFYKEFIEKLLKGHEFELTDQVKYLGRYNPRLDTETDGLIDWNFNSYDLINFINAFDEPYKGASTYINNGNFGKVYLKDVHLHGGDTPNHPYMSGIVSRHDGKWIVISTNSKHMILVEKVIDSKGKNILQKIKVGDRFFTPQKEIDSSKKTRTIYTSKGKK